MRVIIIEDEAQSAQKLRGYLEQIDERIEVLATLTSIHESVTYLNEHLDPDLIFLDVQLTDGESFDIFRKVAVQSFIVFVTAYDQHSLRAFELNTVSYLLKPFDKADVAKALAKCKTYQESPHRAQIKNRYVVRKGNRRFTFSTHDIAYFIKDNVLFLVSKTGEKFLLESSLEKLERSLNAFEFFRISRSAIVHYNCIESFIPESSHRYRLKMKLPGNHELLVSQSRAASFKKWIEPIR